MQPLIWSFLALVSLFYALSSRSWLRTVEIAPLNAMPAIALATAGQLSTLNEKINLLSPPAHHFLSFSAAFHFRACRKTPQNIALWPIIIPASVPGALFAHQGKLNQCQSSRPSGSSCAEEVLPWPLSLDAELSTLNGLSLCLPQAGVNGSQGGNDLPEKREQGVWGKIAGFPPDGQSPLTSQLSPLSAQPWGAGRQRRLARKLEGKSVYSERSRSAGFPPGGN